MAVALTEVQGWGVWKAAGADAHGNKLSRGKLILHILSISLVATHCLYMGFNVESGMTNVLDGRKPSKELFYVDAAFAGAFTIEVLARMIMYERDYYKGPDWRWNLFDITLVTFSLIELASTSFKVGFIRSLRALRAVRAARIIRAVRFVRELRLMVASILCCLTSLTWSLVLLSFVLFLFAILIMQVIATELEFLDGLPENVVEISAYYGSLWKSMVSLFMAITGGIDWAEMSSPVTEYSDWYIILFILYISFAVFGVLNILTAIFVESSSRIADVDSDLVIQDSIEDEKSTMQTLRKILYSSGTCEEGVITKDELETQLEDEKTVAHLRILGLSATEVHGLFSLLDLDDENRVGIDEFVLSMMRLKAGSKGLDVATLMYENKKIMVKLTGLMRFIEDFATGLDGLDGNEPSSMDQYVDEAEMEVRGAKTLPSTFHSSFQIETHKI